MVINYFNYNKQYLFHTFNKEFLILKNFYAAITNKKNCIVLMFLPYHYFRYFPFKNKVNIIIYE